MEETNPFSKAERRNRMSLRRGLLLLAAILAVAAVAVVGFPEMERSLTILSLKKLNDYPLYSMAYHGGYDLNYEAKSPKLASSGGPMMCSGLLAYNNDGDPLFCRNLDYSLADHPIAMLTTRATGKLASVSIADLFYLGYNIGNLPKGSITRDRALLGAPRVPIDGMNEYGVAFAMLSVPHAEPSADPSKKSVDEAAALRLALDSAKNLEEAVEVIQSYNLVFVSGPIHYFIADRSGDSAVVEFIGGKVVVVRKSAPWQTVTNFIVSGQSHDGVGQDRYKTAEDELSAKNGVLSEGEAMALLKRISQPGTLWSVIYNLKTGEVRLALAQDYSNILKFKLDMHQPG